MAVVSNPIERGLIASIARPGGNVSGLSVDTVELTAKQLELLREAFPGASRIAVLWDPAYEASPAMLQSAQAAAALLGVCLHALGARSVEEYDAALAEMARKGAEALLVVADPTFFRDRVRLTELAAKTKVPAMYGSIGGIKARLTERPFSVPPRAPLPSLPASAQRAGTPDRGSQSRRRPPGPRRSSRGSERRPSTSAGSRLVAESGPGAGARAGGELAAPA